MNSFHQSRGRIFFDTLCAFGMSASCAVAWIQTYADALLGAAGIAGLYGLARLTDMFRRAPIVADAAPAEPAAHVATAEAIGPEHVAPVVERKSLDLVGPTPELKPEVVAALVRKPKRKTKRPAKSAPMADEPTDVAPVAPAVVGPDPEPAAPIAPLFEPQPFVRQQQRAAFGRKFGAR